MTYLIQPIVAALITAVLILWLRRFANRIGLVDHPGGRKRHGEPVPLTGGLALTTAFLLTLSLSISVVSGYVVLLVCMSLLAVGGLFDDIGEISPRAKLGLQTLAAVLMTSWGAHFISTLGNLFGTGPIALNYWAIPLTVFATVAVINGINMLDGLDGLAGSLAFVMLGWFAYLAWSFGDSDASKLIVVLMGALTGFLCFNLPHPFRGRHRVFMGDTGSLVLGFVVVWFAVGLSQSPAQVAPPVLMLWIVGVVLLDLATVTLRRVLLRRDPALPDRGHIHHILLRCGLSPVTATFFIVAANGLLAGLGVMLWKAGVDERWLFSSFLAIALAYAAIFMYPARIIRWVRKLRRVR